MLRLVPYYGNEWLNTMDDMNHMIDNFFKPFDDAIYDSFKVDVEKDENGYTITADLPGIKKENIDLSIDEGILGISVHGEEEKEEKDEKGHYLHRERKMFNTSRHINVGKVDESAIKASMDNGVLTVTVPLAKEVESRKSIAIE